MHDPIFTGSAAALISPFVPDGKNVDLAFLEKLIEWQIDNGTDALVIAGTTGESPVLSPDEKRKMFSLAVKAANKRVPVIAGTGSNVTQKVVMNANAAEKEGVDGLLIVTPFYNKCTQDGLIRHYHFIADRVSAPIIVYNVPSRTGVNILPETYAAITEHKNIVGIKEANGDISTAAKTAILCKDKATLYSGNDDQTLSMMAIGAQGVISVAANVIPKQMHEITELALNNDHQAAQSLQATYLHLMDLLFSEVNPIPVKSAVGMLFGHTLPLRLPLTPLSEKNQKILLQELKSLHLIA